MFRLCRERSVERWLCGLAVMLGFVLLLALTAQTVRADDPPGAKLFATYCGACHGDAGKGGFAPAVGTAQYLSTHDDAALTQAIRDGMSKSGMPAWGKSKGGSLTDAQIADIVAYLRALAPAAAPAPTALPTVAAPMQSTAPLPTAVAPAPAAAPEPAATPLPPQQTKLTVTQSTNAAAETVLNVTLNQADGSAVSGADIAFSRATMFGTIDLGTVRTDASGLAVLTLPTLPSNARQVVVAFKGAKNLAASETEMVLEPQALVSSSGDYNPSGVRLSLDEPFLLPDGNLITPNPPLLPTTILAFVVAGVWATYGYVLYQVFRIWKREPGAPRGRALRINRPYRIFD